MMKYVNVDQRDIETFLEMVDRFLRPNMLKDKVTFNFASKNFEMFYETPPYTVSTKTMLQLTTAMQGGYVNCYIFKNIETSNLLVVGVGLDFEVDDRIDLGELLREISE